MGAVSSGLVQKISSSPAATQTIAQPTGTQLQVSQMNGVEYATQYVNGRGNNGIANAVASSDCASGCEVKADQSYAGTEVYTPSTWNSNLSSGTHLEDHRGGERRDSYLNPFDLIHTGQDRRDIYAKHRR